MRIDNEYGKGDRAWRKKRAKRNGVWYVIGGVITECCLITPARTYIYELDHSGTCYSKEEFYRSKSAAQAECDRRNKE